jgi:uncharacterized protein YaiI (UPF0178 family)
VPRVLVDADACPVKPEIVRVATRHGASVTFVARSRMKLPAGARVELVEVPPGHLDAADDWIAERAGSGDVVVTSDIPLAGRCLERGARVVAPDGRTFTEDAIGDALAGRELMAHLRELGAATGGPPPYSARDRSRFLHAFDEALRRAARPR